MRRYAREVAISLIYEYLFNDEKNDLSLDMFDKELLTNEDKLFVAELYNGTVDHIFSYKALVEKYAVGYKLERVFKVDLAIILVAIYELFNTQTPPAVVVNEAVEVAKKYSTKKSISFVNGILAQIVKKELPNK